METIKGQVQTNKYNVNILVDTRKSSNSHSSRYNKDIEVEKVLTDDEIMALALEHLSLDSAKDIVKKLKGYATSNCTSESENIEYSSIVKYKEV